MDNNTRRVLLEKIKSSGYPGSILDVFASYDQGVDLVQDYINQQQEAKGQMPQQQTQIQGQPQSQPELQQPSIPPQSPQPVNLPQQVEPTNTFVNSGDKTPIGMANIRENREAGMINSPAKMQMGGSYDTNQEIAMYEWRTGRPEESRKRYIKGGLRTKVINRFAAGGTADCPPGQMKNWAGQCVPVRSTLVNPLGVSNADTKTVVKDNTLSGVALKNKAVKDEEARVKEEKRQKEWDKKMQNVYPGTATSTLGPIEAAVGALAFGPAALSTISAAAPYVSGALATDATIGGLTLPGVNLGNAVNLGFGLHSANMLGNDIDTGYYTSDAPVVDKITRGLETGLGIVGSPGVLQGMGAGYRGLRNFTKGMPSLSQPTRNTGSLFSGSRSRYSGIDDLKNYTQDINPNIGNAQANDLALIREYKTLGIIPETLNESILLEHPNLLNTVVRRGINDKLTVTRSIANKNFTGSMFSPQREAMRKAVTFSDAIGGNRVGLDWLSEDLNALYHYKGASPNFVDYTYGPYTVKARYPFDFSTGNAGDWLQKYKNLESSISLPVQRGLSNKVGDIVNISDDARAIIGVRGTKGLNPVSVTYNKPFHEFKNELRSLYRMQFDDMPDVTRILLNDKYGLNFTNNDDALKFLDDQIVKMTNEEVGIRMGKPSNLTVPENIKTEYYSPFKHKFKKGGVRKYVNGGPPTQTEQTTYTAKLGGFAKMLYNKSKYKK